MLICFYVHVQDIKLYVRTYSSKYFKYFYLKSIVLSVQYCVSLNFKCQISLLIVAEKDSLEKLIAEVKDL